MRKRIALSIGLLSAAHAVAVLLAAAAVGAAPAPVYRDGPPPGFTGGFGEQSCDACHFAGGVNELPGEVTLEGAPERYSPGETYPLTVTLTRPGMLIGGFQLAARFGDEGVQAGVLAADPGETGRVAIVTDRGVQYAFQLRRGTELAAPETARWTVLWTAPAAGGTVLFHVAANAADASDSIEGDHVYTTEAASQSTKD